MLLKEKVLKPEREKISLYADGQERSEPVVQNSACSFSHPFLEQFSFVESRYPGIILSRQEISYELSVE